MSEGRNRRVRRRRVFYIPGYDPVHPRRYREVYRREAQKQAAISGYTISQSAKRDGGLYGWHVEAEIDGDTVTTDIEVLIWSDIVKDSMDRGIAATYGQLFRTAWAYIGSGALRRLMHLPKGPIVAALYPIVFLLGQALLAGIAATSVAFLLYLGGAPLVGWVAWPLAGTAWLAVGWYVLDRFRKADGRFLAYYLMHDYGYSAQHNGANPPELERRLSEFRGTIAEALQSEADEVLVVGHSSGAHLAVSILADLIRRGEVPENGPELGLLSLGQVVPMVSFLPKADRLRADLHDLSTREELAWVDVTAPADGCTFALCDPVAVSSVAPAEGKIWPVVFSASFSQTMAPERWEALKRKFFQLHFQYLCAFERPKDYDYFQITAGPVTLRDRYRDRPSSRSRIERPVNKFTSRAA